MQFNGKNLFICIIITLTLCFAHIQGSSILVIGCLVAFMAVLFSACNNGFTLPVLLFYLPWSPLMKIDPESFSWYTFGIVMVCLLAFTKRKALFQRYHLIVFFALVFLSLLSQFIDNSFPSFAYFAFMMQIILFPLIKIENDSQKYDFFVTEIFFSVGIVSAALCALYFSAFANIQRFVEVYEYSNIIRRCGFYGDPNFYSAHITAALSGIFALILTENKKSRLTLLLITAVVLMYCGSLSGSKSFVLITIIMVLLWAAALFAIRGRSGLRITLIIVSVIIGIFISTSSVFSELLDVLRTRLTNAENMDEFTTGRLGLWEMYIKEIFSNIKILLLGKGFSNVNVNGRASHSTLIQSIYQFGIIGAPFLVYWYKGYLKEFWGKTRKNNARLENLIIIIGCFAPWVALDVLFFDEFFLMPWFACVAIAHKKTIPKKF